MRLTAPLDEPPSTEDRVPAPTTDPADDTRPGETPAPPIRSAHPLYTVDLDQRITYWDDRACSEIAGRDEALGRRCYEVLPGLDPRNGRCRPNCAVIVAARQGHAANDFEVWGAHEDGTPQARRVSILLQPGDTPGEIGVVHLVRCGTPAPAPRCEASATPVLTERQLAVLRLLAEGRTPQEIACTLAIRLVTVRNHAQAAMDRLSARTRLEAVLLATRAGLL